MSDCMHGDDLSLVDRYVAEGYIQHTPGIGQGREGLRRYLQRGRLEAAGTPRVAAHPALRQR